MLISAEPSCHLPVCHLPARSSPPSSPVDTPALASEGEVLGRGFDKVFHFNPSFPRGTRDQGKRVAVSAAGRWRVAAGRWLFLFFLFFLFLTIRAEAQPLVVYSSSTTSESEIWRLQHQGALGIVHLGTGKLPSPTTESFERLRAKAEQGKIQLLVVAGAEQLTKLRLVVLMGGAVPKDTLLTSPSTRTLGLVTAADLTGEGRLPQFRQDSWIYTRDFYWQLRAAQSTKVPLLILWGGLAGTALFSGLLALRHSSLRKTARALLVLATAGTLSMLPAGLPPFDSGQYALFVCGTLGIAALSRPAKRTSALRDVLLCFVVLVMLDSLLRWRMVASSALSDYYGSGIRFYGIGNEYMGLVIGAALMSVPKKWLGVVGVLLTLLLGIPMLGANAGGAMAAAVAFWPPVKGQRWRLILPFAVAFTLALIDRMQPGTSQSHIGQAAGKGVSAWGEIILRKLAMNARLSVAGPTLVGIGAIAAGIWQLKRLLPQVGEELRGRVGQAYWGAAAAMAFNDSGTVAAILMLAPVIVTVIEQALCDYSESTSAPNASVSPSPTS